MSTPRLFVPPEALQHGTAYLDAAAHRYLIKVLRLEVGAEVILLDGEGGLYRSRVTTIGKLDLQCELDAKEAAGGEPDRPVHLWQAVLKGERMDWLVQKATELGCTEIHLMETGRTVVRGASGKVDRWQSIAREAAEQCERGRIPIVHEPVELRRMALPTGALVCAERRPDTVDLRAAAGETAPAPVHLLVGPEGGWTPEEMTRLIDDGAHPVSLGERILRAETAALAALCQVLLP